MHQGLSWYPEMMQSTNSSSAESFSVAAIGSVGGSKWVRERASAQVLCYTFIYLRFPLFCHSFFVIGPRLRLLISAYSFFDLITHLPHCRFIPIGSSLIHLRHWTITISDSPYDSFLISYIYLVDMPVHTLGFISTLLPLLFSLVARQQVDFSPCC